eukprot:6897484-Pyramimonas_sp.AAC.1
MTSGIEEEGGSRCLGCGLEASWIVLGLLLEGLFGPLEAFLGSHGCLLGSLARLVGPSGCLSRACRRPEGSLKADFDGIAPKTPSSSAALGCPWALGAVLERPCR